MLSSCKHRYWFKGCKQPRDLGMPEMMWGNYLPGDEPGYMCKLENDYCSEDIEDCPLWKLTGMLCEVCESAILTDGVINYCPFCGEEK